MLGILQRRRRAQRVAGLLSVIACEGVSERYLAATSHFPLAHEEPIDRNALLERQRDQKVRVRCRAALIAVDVLLEHA